MYAWIETSKGRPVDRAAGTSESRDAGAHPRRNLDGDLRRGYRNRLLHARLEAVLQAVRRPRGEPPSTCGPSTTRLPGWHRRFSPRRRSQSVAIKATDTTKLAVIAREYEGDLYLFAVNYDEREVEAEATITVELLPAGTEVIVIDEDRTPPLRCGLLHSIRSPRWRCISTGLRGSGRDRVQCGTQRQTIHRFRRFHRLERDGANPCVPVQGRPNSSDSTAQSDAGEADQSVALGTDRSTTVFRPARATRARR